MDWRVFRPIPRSSPPLSFSILKASGADDGGSVEGFYDICAVHGASVG